jgi:hypothetical protein
VHADPEGSRLPAKRFSHAGLPPDGRAEARGTKAAQRRAGRFGRRGRPLRARTGQSRSLSAFLPWAQRDTALKLPILSLSFTDDEFLKRRNIESPHGFHSGATAEMQRIAPTDVDLPRIGHFGSFRNRCEASLWPRVADWIDRHVELQH